MRAVLEILAALFNIMLNSGEEIQGPDLDSTVQRAEGLVQQVSAAAAGAGAGDASSDSIGETGGVPGGNFAISFGKNRGVSNAQAFLNKRFRTWYVNRANSKNLTPTQKHLAKYCIARLKQGKDIDCDSLSELRRWHCGHCRAILTSKTTNLQAVSQSLAPWTLADSAFLKLLRDLIFRAWLLE